MPRAGTRAKPKSARKPARRAAPTAKADKGPEQINADLIKLAVPIADLKEDPDNVRVHSDRNLDAIEASLKAFGQQRPLVALDDGTVVAGNGTLKVMRRIGWRRAAIVRFPDREAARAYAIADNRTGELATWDAEALGSSLGELELAGWAAGDLGFTDADRNRLRRSANLEEDHAPKLPAEATSEPGQVWILGEHRIACGDATDPLTIARLMGPEQAALIFTDPPYGVAYEAQSGKHSALVGDELQRGELQGMLTAAFKIALDHATPDVAAYIWHASSSREDFVRAMVGAGLEELQYLIWVKPSITIGWSDYQWAHEPCFYAGRAGVRPPFYANRDASTAWRIEARVGDRARAIAVGPGIVVSTPDGAELWISPKPPKRRLRHVQLVEDEALFLDGGEGADVVEVGRDERPEHPTQKPVELATRAIHNSSRAGEVVLDPFLGSGSTLIGAEMTGRRCFGTELDPRYIDVIIKRWTALTGGTAELEEAP